MSEVNTLLIGRNRLFLEGLKSLLRGSAFDTKQEVSSVAELDLFDEDDAPELILSELRGEVAELEQDIQQQREELPGGAVVVMADERDPDKQAAWLHAGGAAARRKERCLARLHNPRKHPTE